MLGRIVAIAVFCFGVAGAVHAAPVGAPGPDIGSGFLEVTLATGFAWALIRRRNKA